MTAPITQYTGICLFFLCIISCDQKSADNFVLKTEPGKLYHFTVELEEASSRNTAIFPAVSQQFAFALQLEKQVEDLQTFNLVYERISVTSPRQITTTHENGAVEVRPGLPMTLSTDSAKNYSPLIKDAGRTHWYRLVPRIIGDSIRVTLNELGNLENTWGYETIRDNIAAATNEDIRNVSPAIRGYVGPDAVTDMLNGLFFYLPGKKIRVGEQWVKNIVFTQHAPIKNSHNITVESIKDDTVHLSVQSIISARLGEGKLITTGELAGKIAASLSTGMLYNMELTENSVMHTDHYDVNRKRIMRVRVRQSPAR